MAQCMMILLFPLLLLRMCCVLCAVRTYVCTRIWRILYPWVLSRTIIYSIVVIISASSVACHVPTAAIILSYAYVPLAARNMDDLDETMHRLSSIFVCLPVITGRLVFAYIRIHGAMTLEKKDTYAFLLVQNTEYSQCRICRIPVVPRIHRVQTRKRTYYFCPLYGRY